MPCWTSEPNEEHPGTWLRAERTRVAEGWTCPGIRDAASASHLSGMTTSALRSHSMTSRPCEVVVSIGTTLLPPATLAAIAYYFAVKRQQTLALYFGIDPSVLGFTTEDYLLRSGDALFLLALAGALVGLGAIHGHAAVTKILHDPARDVPVQQLSTRPRAPGSSCSLSRSSRCSRAYRSARVSCFLRSPSGRGSRSSPTECT